MMVSIITPCSRPLNLPTLYWSILNMNTDDVEWIIIYDGDVVDRRILQYQDRVSIKLFNKIPDNNDLRGTRCNKLRNIGIENSIGDYLYFLDDDNIVHPKLYDRICRYKDDENTKILVFNQYSPKFNERISRLDESCVKEGVLDTAQFVVPRIYKTRWTTNQINYYEEIDYFKNLMNEAGMDNIIWINRLYTFRNYLRLGEIL